MSRSHVHYSFWLIRLNVPAKGLTIKENVPSIIVLLVLLYFGRDELGRKDRVIITETNGYIIITMWHNIMRTVVNYLAQLFFLLKFGECEMIAFSSQSDIDMIPRSKLSYKNALGLDRTPLSRAQKIHSVL